LIFFYLQLLVGIKDTNEQLVSATLRALADLIPVLGAAAVIGGKRAKLFTDGRPKVSMLIVTTLILLFHLTRSSHQFHHNLLLF